MNSITSKFRDNKLKLYFSKNELCRILEFYSFGVSKGNWKDYAIQFEMDSAFFHFFKNTSEKPQISISKTLSKKNKKANFQVIQNSIKNINDEKLDNLFIYLKRKELKIIKI